MRHEHLVVTVEAETKSRIDDRLDGGESLEAWVADAIERKLVAGGDEQADSREATAEPARKADPEDLALSGADGADADDYDEGFEYVDDCGI